MLRTEMFVGVVLAVSMSVSGSASAEASNETTTARAGRAETGVSASPAAPSNVAATESSPGSPNVVAGRVEQVDLAHNLTIAGSERVGLAFEKFKLEPGSEITLHGQRASIDDLNEGDEVRASFSRQGKELQVRRLDIVSGSTTGGRSPAAPRSAPTENRNPSGGTVR